MKAERSKFWISEVHSSRCADEVSDRNRFMPPVAMFAIVPLMFLLLDVVSHPVPFLFEGPSLATSLKPSFFHRIFTHFASRNYGEMMTFSWHTSGKSFKFTIHLH